MSDPVILRLGPNSAVAFNVAPAGPSSISGRTLDVDALTLGLSDATALPTWADGSGAGNDLTDQTGESDEYAHYFATGGIDSQAFVGIPNLPTSQLCQLGNTGFATDRRSFSAFFVLTLNNVAGSKYLLSLGSGNVIIGVVAGVVMVFNSGVGFQSTTQIVPTGRKVAVLVTSSASAVKVYFDAATNVQTLPDPLNSGTTTGLLYPGAASSILQQAYRTVMWDRALTAGEAATLFAYAASAYGTGTSAAAPTGYVATDGDSTCFGAGDSRGRNWSFFLNPGNGYYGFCAGRNGTTTADLLSDRYSYPAAGPNSWFIPMIGVNDLNGGATAADTEAGYAAVCAGVEAQGTPRSNIIAVTLSCAAQLGGRRDAYNTLKRAGHTAYAGRLVDIAAHPAIGVIPGGGLRDQATYMPDGTHGNAAFDAAVAALIRASIPAVPW